MKIPTFYMLIGLPGSGKSYWASKKDIKIHSSDEIRLELFNNLRQDKNLEVFSLLHCRVKESLKNNESCIYDATNLNRKKRIAFLNELNNIKCKKVAILFSTPLSVCIDRNNMRHGERCIDESIIWNMAKQFNIPLKNEGFDEIRIKWSKEKYISTYSFSNELFEFNQESKYHNLSLGEHLLNAHDYILSRYNDKFLALTALLHDIGKIKTKTFINSKGEITKEAHYYAHENIGAYMVLTESPFDVNNTNVDSLRDDQYTMAVLINMHMRPLVWLQSEKAKEKDRKLLGEYLFHQLVKLNKADIQAH